MRKSAEFRGPSPRPNPIRSLLRAHKIPDLPKYESRVEETEKSSLAAAEQSSYGAIAGSQERLHTRIQSKVGAAKLHNQQEDDFRSFAEKMAGLQGEISEMRETAANPYLQQKMNAETDLLAKEAELKRLEAEKGARERALNDSNSQLLEAFRIDPHVPQAIELQHTEK